jgi:hypothetical protein
MSQLINLAALSLILSPLSLIELYGCDMYFNIDGATLGTFG